MANYHNMERHPVGSYFVGYCASDGRACRVTKNKGAGYWEITRSSAGPDHGSYLGRGRSLRDVSAKLETL